jgi:Prefoldin subunit
MPQHTTVSPPLPHSISQAPMSRPRQEADSGPAWSASLSDGHDVSAPASPLDPTREGYTKAEAHRHAQSIAQRLAEVRRSDESLIRLQREFSEVSALLDGSASSAEVPPLPLSLSSFSALQFLLSSQSSLRRSPCHSQRQNHMAYCALCRVPFLARFQAAPLGSVCALADRISHSVNVPLGSQAFMRGRIVHGGEVTILLGEGYFARMSASQAAAVLQRRSALLGERRSALEAQRQELLRRAGVSHAVLQVWSPQDWSPFCVVWEGWLLGVLLVGGIASCVLYLSLVLANSLSLSLFHSLSLSFSPSLSLPLSACACILLLVAKR